MAPPYRRQRSDAPFTEEQETWLILEYGAVKNISVLKRHFQQHFVITTRKVPSYMAFKRLVERFIATQGTLHPAVPIRVGPQDEKSSNLLITADSTGSIHKNAREKKFDPKKVRLGCGDLI